MPGLTEKEKTEYMAIAGSYLANYHVQMMKAFIQHGSVTTYDHCCSVATLAFCLNRRLKLGLDEKTLVAGALLHDFCLYDWHLPHREMGLHGFTHPATACGNAVKYFGVGPKVQDVIRSHMWPVTLFVLPHSGEAWLVSFTDKYVAFIETFFKR